MQRIDQEQRDQLFWELIGPIIVRAIGCGGLRAIGVVIGAHQMVAGGLAGRIGGIGLIGRDLAKGRIAGPQTTIDLVGRDMVEPVRLA